MQARSTTRTIEYNESTFAALPVGASKTDRFPTIDNDLIIDEINVVLPVPAYPFKIKMLLFPKVVIKSTNLLMASF